MMFKVALFVFCVSIFSCAGVHQDKNVDFYFLPGNSYQVDGRAEDQKPATGTVYIKTKSSAKKSYRWKKVFDSSPSEWHTYYCDNVSCYFIMPDSSDIHAIDASMKDDQNRMKLYVEPNGAAGFGTVKIAVYDPADRLNADTITYQVSIK